jgi:hypothetical protein
VPLFWARPAIRSCRPGPPWYPGTPATSSNRPVTSELPDIYREAGAAGAFVFEFAEPCKPHSADPRHDLDMSGYGIVKVLSGPSADPVRWEPKAAFAEVARIYRDTP